VGNYQVAVYVILAVVSLVGVAMCQIMQTRFLRKQGSPEGHPYIVFATIAATIRAGLFRKSLLTYFLPMSLFSLVLPGVAIVSLGGHEIKHKTQLGRLIEHIFAVTAGKNGTTRFLMGLDIVDWMLMLVLVCSIVCGVLIQKNEIDHIRESKATLMDHWLARGIWFPMLSAFSEMAPSERKRMMLGYFVPIALVCVIIFITIFILANRGHGFFSYGVFDAFRAMRGAFA